MDWLNRLEEQCSEVALLLRGQALPKEERRRLRAVLAGIFRLREQPAESLSDDALAELKEFAREIDAALGGAPVELPVDTLVDSLLERLDRWTQLDPVRIEGAFRREWAREMLARYLGMELKIQSRVDWFWDRCQAQSPLAANTTIEEKAREDLDDLGLEFVWGRRRRF